MNQENQENETRHKRSNTVRFYLYEVPKSEKYIEAEGRIDNDRN
jgi:hypothetical protein